MRVTVHCPSLYDEAADNPRNRGALIHLLARTLENPWLMPNDPTVVSAIHRFLGMWSDAEDREKVQYLLERMNKLGRIVRIPVNGGTQDPIQRAHRLAERCLLVEPLSRHGTKGSQTWSTGKSASSEFLLEEGVDNDWVGGLALPAPDVTVATWSSKKFSEEVWAPIFRWSTSLRIVDRNITKFWIPKKGCPANYQESLAWILESFGHLQPQGRVVIDLVRNGDAETKLLIRRWCEYRADQLGISIETYDRLSHDFHDRYFYTQQGWWRCHRGVDMRKWSETNGWVIRRDVELRWQRYCPRGL